MLSDQPVQKQFCWQLTTLVKLWYVYINGEKTTSFQRWNNVDKYTSAQPNINRISTLKQRWWTLTINVALTLIWRWCVCWVAVFFLQCTTFQIYRMELERCSFSKKLLYRRLHLTSWQIELLCISPIQILRWFAVGYYQLMCFPWVK